MPVSSLGAATDAVKRIGYARKRNCSNTAPRRTCQFVRDRRGQVAFQKVFVQSHGFSAGQWATAPEARADPRNTDQFGSAPSSHQILAKTAMSRADQKRNGAFTQDGTCDRGSKEIP